MKIEKVISSYVMTAKLQFRTFNLYPLSYQKANFNKDNILT